MIINPDGTIYHLKLKPENIADTILLVGDPGRVSSVSSHFDSIEYTGQNREIITHTGIYKRKRITVISTGMGPDNIDIVINELDALANVDLDNRVPRSEHTALNLIRIGTSGTIQHDIPIDTFGVASYGLGMDGLAHFYKTGDGVIDEELSREFIVQTNWPADLPGPYIVKADPGLEEKLGKGMIAGITVTAPGFYGPQGRMLRIGLKYPDLNERIAGFRHNGLRVINFEMETSALYSLGKTLGHNVLTVCAIIANRAYEKYSKNPEKPVEDLIGLVLQRLVD